MSDKAKKKRNIHIQLTEHALEILTKASMETGMNRTAMIELIIRKYCKKQELI